MAREEPGAYALATRLGDDNFKCLAGMAGLKPVRWRTRAA